MPGQCKLLILDYGGVYSFPRINQNFFNLIMQKSFGIIPTDRQRHLISQKSQLLSQNKISSVEYIDQLALMLNPPRTPSPEQFERATVVVTSPPSPAMKDLVANARQVGIKVALLSDMYLFEAKLTRPWGRYDGFDHVDLSAEMGLSKAQPQFFWHVLNYFKLQPHQALFVDDKPINIQTAQSVGLVTLLADRQQFSHVEALAEKVWQLLLAD